MISIQSDESSSHTLTWLTPFAGWLVGPHRAITCIVLQALTNRIHWRVFIWLRFATAGESSASLETTSSYRRSWWGAKAIHFCSDNISCRMHSNAVSPPGRLNHGLAERGCFTRHMFSHMAANVSSLWHCSMVRELTFQKISMFI